jgi:hypothetical protein
MRKEVTEMPDGRIIIYYWLDDDEEQGEPTET